MRSTTAVGLLSLWLTGTAAAAEELPAPAVVDRSVLAPGVLGADTSDCGPATVVLPLVDSVTWWRVGSGSGGSVGGDEAVGPTVVIDSAETTRFRATLSQGAQFGGGGTTAEWTVGPVAADVLTGCTVLPAGPPVDAGGLPPTGTPEPTGDPEPVATPESVTAEPVATPGSVATPEAVKTPEPVATSAPTVTRAPVVAPAPVGRAGADDRAAVEPDATAAGAAEAAVIRAASDARLLLAEDVEGVGLGAPGADAARTRTPAERATSPQVRATLTSAAAASGSGASGTIGLGVLAVVLLAGGAVAGYRFRHLLR